jgi:hypothetical protein
MGLMSGVENKDGMAGCWCGGSGWISLAYSQLTHRYSIETTKQTEREREI